ncbi:sensor histidine kinase [Salegentibacter chungangensis]|uniref:histidine kinase n=1 Tax=Salegentibacter chungangensis TaxID=1335724 RepID=A0ABW3NUF3_9FLAO
MLAEEDILLIVYFVVVILMLTAFTIIFFITYQRRKNKLLIDQYEARKRYEEELVRSRLEIQDQTLKNVGWELHDNIGQLLSVANMQLNILARTSDDPNNESVKEVKEIVASSLQEVRALSKSLNSDVVEYAGLKASVKNEFARFERLNVIGTRLEITGEEHELPKQDAIILFRILQEFFSNVVKHSKAELLSLRMDYLPGELKIVVTDNGTGFDPEEVQKSSGLLNMKNRAELINAEFSLDSAPGEGTSLSLRYPTKTTKNEQDDNNR